MLLSLLSLQGRYTSTYIYTYPYTYTYTCTCTCTYTYRNTPASASTLSRDALWLKSAAETVEILAECRLVLLNLASETVNGLAG
jgi:2-iminoacetate synthase ThiH